MFRSSKSKQERKLQKKIDRLSTEAYKLSTNDRMVSARKYAEADQLQQELKAVIENTH